MNNYYKEIIKKLENEIKEVSLELDGSIALYEVIIELILSILSEIKEYILKNGFESIDGEIHFFKYQKPVIVAKLIYYNAIYKIETKKPYGEKQVKKYLNKEQKKLKKFFDNNIDFYKYYRSGNSFLDENFFVRGKHDIRLWLDTFYFEADHRFCTSHDYKVAKIIANDLIQVYLEDQLHNIIYKDKSIDLPTLSWTGSKAALTELIYGLHSQAVFNNGNTDIITIVRFFENSFNVDLGDFYHKFLELKARKLNRTKFLDSLRDALIKKMEEQDEI